MTSDINHFISTSQKEEGNHAMKNGSSRIHLSIISWMIGLLLVSSVAWGEEVTPEVKKSIDKILLVLRDPQYKEPARKAEKKALIRKMVDERFNWEEMARRSLGVHWRDRSAAEREEFVKLFSKLLERNYIDKVDSYSGEEIVFLGEMVDGNYAQVSTNVVTKKNTEIPLNYRLIKKNGQWRVYDIVIEGISLVNNYRSQFNSILVQSSFKELLEKIKAKDSN